jgi:hypothetical protein
MEKFTGPIELTEAELMAVAGGVVDLRTAFTNSTEASIEGLLPHFITGQEAELDHIQALNGSAAQGQPD